MHAIRSEDIDGPGKRCGDRGHKNGETPVLQFFNDEGGHQVLLDFSKRRFPHAFLTTSRQLLGQTPEERVTWNSFEERFLDSLSRRSPSRCAHGNACQETDKQHEEKREDLFSGKPLRKKLGKWPHQPSD